ncbi:hypothetical protein [Tichowtungia aerotolerans]|uniref:Uncharacterized protein n=1 Tax=Tichowtungia aerotolerans TaxID=2697043 RepID=A0A6P1M2V0_9BACT|nr:hypothetical protein [Tichowtungia aerotolerans]QHI68161.1 hypothetical protein GT409_01420 [Tichowtungia aerotolerans]
MKFSVQFTPALGGALICTLLWYAFWLVAFQPNADHPVLSAVQGNASLQMANASQIPDFSNPTLFALPSQQGFSEGFPSDRVSLTLRFDSPKQPLFDLPPGDIRKGDPNPAPLMEAVAAPGSKIHLPGSTRIVRVRQGQRVELFLSPELRTRMDQPPEIDPPGELPESVRVHLNVRPNGTVANIFFDTPVQNPHLIAAVMRLRFAPASKQTTGWLELRCKGETS